jgi:hypothetical protein
MIGFVFLPLCICSALDDGAKFFRQNSVQFQCKICRPYLTELCKDNKP